MLSKINHYFKAMFSVLLITLFMVQAPTVVFAENLDDNYGETIDVVSSDDTMSYNDGEIVENNGEVAFNDGTVSTNNGVVEENYGDIDVNNGSVNHNSYESTISENNGKVETNSGTINNNSGTVVNNSGDVKENDGNIVSNNGEVGTNSDTINNNNGYVEANEGNIVENSEAGSVETNSGVIQTNQGRVWENDGTVQNNNSKGIVTDNKGKIEKNSGKVRMNEGVIVKNAGDVEDNEGTVKENYGYVYNDGPWVIGPFVAFSDKKKGVVETNYGTVYNAGIVKVNKGKVYNDGGTIEKDEGEHYFRVWFWLPANLPNSAWSYSVDKGFVNYNNFDRWIEKDSVGQLTFRLNKGYGWEYDRNAKGDPDGYRGWFNKDGNLTIVIDRMNEWLQETYLVIPLKQISYGNSSNYKKVSTTTPVEMYKLTFDLDGGAFYKGTDEEEMGIVERFYEKGEEIEFTEIPEKDGYKFVCWEEVVPEDEEEIETTESAETEEKQEPPRYKEHDKYTVSKNADFKAIWEKE